MSLQPGQMLSHYRIIEKIGAGGMGEVWKAMDSALGREVAIKILPAAFSGDADRLARFEREAQLLASLNHPNIATIHGLHESEGIRFLAMELVAGQDLAELLSAGPMASDEALVVARQLAEALEAAHASGVIHRDLKPANILRGDDGRIKVLDFGLAKALAPDGTSGATSASQSPTVTAGTVAGTLLGTAAYMSPEQARCLPVDRQTDIWAFGCVLYELLTGHKAFGGDSVSDTLAAVLKTEPDWSALPVDTPAPIHRLLRRCLQKNRSQRVHHIGDARLEIDEAIAGTSIEAPGDHHRAVVRRPAWRRYLSAGVTVILPLVGLLLGYLWGNLAPPSGRVIRFQIPAPAGTTFNLDPEISGPAVISPDGRMLAFSARDDHGKLRLYVRPLDTTETRMLAGTDHAFYPFWSPDSRFIGFFAQGQLKKVEATGGPPFIICDAPSGQGGSWNSEGVIVFAPGNGTPLHRVSVTGGESTPITRLESARRDRSHRHPRFLPDGRGFLYLAMVNEPGRSEVVLAGSLDGEEDKLLLRSAAQADFASGHLLFLRGGILMARAFDLQRLEFKGDALTVAENVTLDGDACHAAFSVSANGALVYHAGDRLARSRLEWFDRGGSSRGSLGEPAEYIEVRLSPDGTHAAVSLAPSGGFELWTYEIARNIRTRFAFGSSNWYPSWSPDSRDLVFTSSRDGHYGLYRKSLYGPGKEELLLESQNLMFAGVWSPDGKLLTFDRQGQDTAYDIWILPLEPGREPYPFVQTPFIEAGSAFSPDGRWLAYQSIESGRWEVYVTPFPTPGRKWLVSAGGGAWPIWRGDGEEIFYHGLNGDLMAVDVSARDDTFEVGAIEALFPMTKLGNFPTYAATKDGQRFLVVRPEKEADSSPLNLVLNWTAGME